MLSRNRDSVLIENPNTTPRLATRSNIARGGTDRDGDVDGRFDCDGCDG